MNVSEQVNLPLKHNKWVVASLVLGLTTLVFPLISVVFLLTENGGARYLQSLFCGIPVAIVSIIAGITALAQQQGKDKAGRWMALSGIVSGALFFVVALVLVLLLLFPYLSGTAD